MRSIVAIAHRLRLAFAAFAGAAVVAVPFAAIELWSNLWHDPFYPHDKAQGWATFAFSLYGAAFLGAVGCGTSFLALSLLRRPHAPPSRQTFLAFGLLGALVYVLFHHSKHVLWYWESGGTW